MELLTGVYIYNILMATWPTSVSKVVGCSCQASVGPCLLRMWARSPRDITFYDIRMISFGVMKFDRVR